jgi:signal transduction histidine kinase
LAELTQRGSFGLMGIQERVWAMGGTLEIHSSPGEGTSVCAVMPISPPESEIP